MNLGDLRKHCRRESGDLEKPYFMADEEWNDALNEAVDEACIRARLIEREDLELDASANEPYAAIPEYAWLIDRVTFGGRRLMLVDKKMLDEAEGDGWEARTADIPVACYEVGGKLRFYPVPTTTGSVIAHAFCTPANPMVDDEDEPEGIKTRLHVKLVDWAMRCYRSKNDAEIFNGQQAAEYETNFEKTFGPRPDEKAMRRLRINVRRYVKGSYF